MSKEKENFMNILRLKQSYFGKLDKVDYYILSLVLEDIQQFLCAALELSIIEPEEHMALEDESCQLFVAAVNKLSGITG